MAADLLKFVENSICCGKNSLAFQTAHVFEELLQIQVSSVLRNKNKTHIKGMICLGHRQR
jgi:hypothetical protein